MQSGHAKAGKRGSSHLPAIIKVRSDASINSRGANNSKVSVIV